MLFNYRLLASEHLLGTILLTGLTLALSLRAPEPGAERYLRVTLILEALAAFTAVPMLLGESRVALVRLAFWLFAAAAVSFVIFGVATIRERWRSIQSRRGS
jgi:phosphatidylglycerophosphate synthase